METICGATFSLNRRRGPFVFVPRGVVHTAHVTRPLRGLLIYSPGDAEHVTAAV